MAEQTCIKIPKINLKQEKNIFFFYTNCNKLLRIYFATAAKINLVEKSVESVDNSDKTAI